MLGNRDASSSGGLVGPLPSFGVSGLLLYAPILICTYYLIKINYVDVQKPPLDKYVK